MRSPRRRTRWPGYLAAAVDVDAYLHSVMTHDGDGTWRRRKGRGSASDPRPRLLPVTVGDPGAQVLLPPASWTVVEISLANG